MAIHAYVWCWGKTCGPLNEIPSVTQWEVEKVKPLMNSNMTLTVLYLHQKTPKGVTTNIQVKRYKTDIREIKPVER